MAGQSQILKAVTGTKQSQVTQYKNGKLIPQTQMVLKKTEDIEAYVFQIVRNYFRTTYKAGITRNSKLSDHGLDSLDAIELAMQIEEDLGYVISTEVLSQFQTVANYITYIEQVEAFKKQSNKNPIP